MVVSNKAKSARLPQKHPDSNLKTWVSQYALFPLLLSDILFNKFVSYVGEDILYVIMIDTFVAYCFNIYYWNHKQRNWPTYSNIIMKLLSIILKSCMK